MTDKKLTRQAIESVDREPFARKLGIHLLDCAPGYARVEMTPTEELGNLFQMVHGGAIFSLIDEAFQVACNSHGTLAVALGLSISYLKAPAMEVSLQAETREVSRNPRIATYETTVKDESGNLIATASATAYRKKENNFFHET
ncbi:MAG: PaaI family thioesterase [Pseudomonadota bacterium]|nr:PaaI family thioesterase [Pseudomonadota bacterium]